MDELLASLRQMNRLLAAAHDRDPDQLRGLMLLVDDAIHHIESRIELGVAEAEIQQMAARDILEIQRLFGQLCNTSEAPWHNN